MKILIHATLSTWEINRLWSNASVVLILIAICFLKCYGVASCFVPSDSLLFYFTDYALVMPVELISAFYLDEKSSDWLIDSGATKQMCHDKSAFDPGTFKPGAPKWVSGV